jgi:quercetin dioxygenase-like cupin family protein
VNSVPGLEHDVGKEVTMTTEPAHAFPAFACVQGVEPIRRTDEHDGHGPIVFRRLLTSADFAAPVDFVDVTWIPPGSTIGMHRHERSEELYIVIAGEPRVEVDGEERRLGVGDVAVVHAGGRHALVNDTAADVAIAVVQLAVRS